MEQPQSIITATARQQNSAPAVKTIGLSKWIDERPIVSNIDLTISPGEYVALLGANGAGKSTLLRLMVGLISPSEGSIELCGQALGRDSASLRQQIGFISHQSMLYRDLSARENIAFFAKLYGVTDIQNRTNEILEKVGLLDRADDPVKTFSRGMTQRVSIARALIHDPQIILADEPFAGLDVRSIDVLEKLLGDLHQRQRTLVVVNHDMTQSLRIAKRVVLLRAGKVALDKPSSELQLEALLAEVNRS